MVFDKAGNLYGTTASGGTQNYGVVFKLAQQKTGTWVETVLYSFKGGSDGGVPNPGVILDAAGNLYGTTLSNGCDPSVCEVVFKLAPQKDGSWKESVLYTFANDNNEGDNGGDPLAGLVFDTAGNLYGTASGEGPNASGTVFRLSPEPGGTWTFTVIYGFSFFQPSDGTGPDPVRTPLACLLGEIKNCALRHYGLDSSQQYVDV